MNKYPGSNKDQLYEADYIHTHTDLSCHDCDCDSDRRVTRDSDDTDDDEDKENEPQDGGHWLRIHRGTIASGESVMKDGLLRDELAKEHDILCFETEAAGALDDFPCLVTRGISNHADSHKNDIWQGYAAAVAAAYSRELFLYLPVYTVARWEVTEAGKSEAIPILKVQQAAHVYNNYRSRASDEIYSGFCVSESSCHHQGVAKSFRAPSGLYARSRTTSRWY